MVDTVSKTVLHHLDGYCERAGDPALLAEPLNAATNLFFILAAVLAARAIRKLGVGENRPRLDLWLLVIALFSIGIGSGLWHLNPTSNTILMDVIPITAFINIYLIAGLRRLFGLNWTKTILLWALYFILCVSAQYILPPTLLNGTIMYIPTYVTLILLTLGLAMRRHPATRAFMVIVCMWSLSLICRTVDLQICNAFTFGTHFLWHTLNAWVLWRLLMVCILPKPIKL